VPSYAVLLRGVNVGKGNRLPMADFRALLEALGFSEVRTLLNSGNAVFTTPRARKPELIAKAIHDAVAERFGFAVDIIVKSKEDVDQVVAGNTLAAGCDAPSRLLVIFTQNPALLPPLTALASLAVAGERLLVQPQAAYLHCAQGILESKIGSALVGKTGRGLTTRNWATVLKLQGMLTGG
jgi:uncharacterized protein (DUF1697 family)